MRPFSGSISHRCFRRTNTFMTVQWPKTMVLRNFRSSDIGHDSCPKKIKRKQMARQTDKNKRRTGKVVKLEDNCTQADTQICFLSFRGPCTPLEINQKKRRGVGKVETFLSVCLRITSREGSGKDFEGGGKGWTQNC